jgi:predicted RNase H-like nuclease
LPAKEYPSEQVCAVKIAESVAKIRDVDSELAANKKLKGELRDAQAKLLESAGYDPAKYIKWVDNGEIAPKN